MYGYHREKLHVNHLCELKGSLIYSPTETLQEPGGISFG